MDDTLFNKIFSAAAGVWAMAAMAFVALFKSWPLIMARINERRRDAEHEKDGDWTRLRAERDRLHALLRECEKERAELMARAIQAEATLQGYGIARQHVAVEDATKRIDEADKRGKSND